MISDYEWVSPYILKNKLPYDVFSELLSASSTTNYVSKLVGMFPDQYGIDLEDCKLFESHVLMVSDFFAATKKGSPVFTEIVQNIPKNTNMCLYDLWINKMYSGSYNRLHRHNGVFSFIIFLDVPYTMEDQIKLENYIDDPEKVVNGCTEFIDPFSQSSYLLKVERGIEGNMFLFPAWIRHVVYPFKNVDSPRVTIAGNIHFDYKK